MQPDDARHGKYAGFLAHMAAGTDICDACKAARLRYNKRLRLDHQRGIRRSLSLTGSRRRLQALHALGYTQTELARRLGVTLQRVQQWIDCEKYTRIYPATAEKIAALYDELCMTPPPEGTSADRSRRSAARRGWVVPLLWDDIDLDAEPNVVKKYKKDGLLDEIAVQRVLDGDDKIARSLTPAERREVVRRWPRALHELEQFTGWNVHRYTSKEAA